MLFRSLEGRSKKKSLGWLPFNGQTFKFHGGYCDYNGLKLRLWEHRKLPESAKVKKLAALPRTQGDDGIFALPAKYRMKIIT